MGDNQLKVQSNFGHGPRLPTNCVLHSMIGDGKEGFLPRSRVVRVRKALSPMLTAKHSLVVFLYPARCDPSRGRKR